LIFSSPGKARSAIGLAPQAWPLTLRSYKQIFNLKIVYRKWVLETIFQKVLILCGF